MARVPRQWYVDTPSSFNTSFRNTPSLRLPPYPANGAWDAESVSTFSTSLFATFNNTHYDYDGWPNLYHNFNFIPSKIFVSFKHDLTNTLTVSDSTGIAEGLVYSIGWEGHCSTAEKGSLHHRRRLRYCKGVRWGQEDCRTQGDNIPAPTALTPPTRWTCSIEKGPQWVFEVRMIMHQGSRTVRSV
ncbi:hypothetical protein P280DRAFT_464859 [Massarina eburnea CBS 473.64]|uniref:Uncharacterized protein n=1 Tax=Massarina eburnea CBS 473.64 TaxID=1395130 RepID=A0A6A6SJ31_9PLEO|nr:hypothetical protein P280DRAFT_464859 [Massarina eburnea CBS 473.64]